MNFEHISKRKEFFACSQNAMEVDFICSVLM
jgi:hypothetical protein